MARTPSKAPRASATFAARQVLLPAPEARRDEAGAERRRRFAPGIGQEGGQGLVRPVDAVVAQDGGQRIADLGGAGGAGGRVERPGRRRMSRARGSPSAGFTDRGSGKSPGDQPAQRGGGVGRLEGQPAGAQPVEDGAQGEDVGALVGLLPSTISGAMWLGDPTSAPVMVMRSSCEQDAGDAEVGELHRRSPSELGDHHVLGLQIPVDDPGGVGVRERVGERQPDERAALRAAECPPRRRRRAASGRGRTR